MKTPHKTTRDLGAEFTQDMENILNGNYDSAMSVEVQTTQDILSLHIQEVAKNHQVQKDIDTYLFGGTGSGEMKEKWEDRFYSFIDELKKDAGEIPENTCPNIDKCIKEINEYEKQVNYLEKQSRNYETVEEVISDLPSYGWDNPISYLEDLRKDNERLRELGKTWYQNCKDMKSFIEYERSLAQQEILDRALVELSKLEPFSEMAGLKVVDFVQKQEVEELLSTLKDTNI